MNRRALLATACLAVVAPLVPANAAAASPPCTRVVVSTAFKTDHTAYCFAGIAGNVDQQRASFVETRGTQVWRTTNGGRTWEPRSTFTSGPEQKGGFERVYDAWAIAGGDTRALYVAARSGLYASFDGAKTYHLVDPNATPSSFHLGAYDFVDSPLTPSVGAFQPAPGAPKLTGTLFAYGGDDLPSAMIDTGNDLHVGVAGAGPGTVRFLLPADFGTKGAALALAGDPHPKESTGSSSIVSVESLYACPAALACPQKLATFPLNRNVEGLWLAPDYVTSHRVLATHRPAWWTTNRNEADLTVVESTDGGATFHTWASIETLLKPIRASKPSRIELELANGSAGNTIYARIGTYANGTGFPTFPQDQLYRSADAGRSWRRVAYLSYDRTNGRAFRGNLPFLPNSVAYYNAFPFAVGGDGTLFATGWRRSGDDPAPTVWCSRDHGAHWAARCPR
jgi:hypothetical protein